MLLVEKSLANKIDHLINLLRHDLRKYDYIVTSSFHVTFNVNSFLDNATYMVYFNYPDLSSVNAFELVKLELIETKSVNDNRLKPIIIDNEYRIIDIQSHNRMAGYLFIEYLSETYCIQVFGTGKQDE